MNKEEFMQQYILTRVSHKKKLNDLLDEALIAWEFIQANK